MLSKGKFKDPKKSFKIPSKIFRIFCMIIETEMFRFHSSWSRCVGNFSQHSRRKKFKLHLPPHLYSKSSSRVVGRSSKEKKSFIVPFFCCAHVATMTLLLRLIYVTIWNLIEVSINDKKWMKNSGRCRLVQNYAISFLLFLRFYISFRTNSRL